MTILVVDDEEDILRLIEIILQAAGYHVLRAHCAEEALELAEINPDSIDLLLTDIRMQSGQDGYDLAHVVRRMRPKIKVLYMSAFTDDNLLRRELDDPKMGFILKPFKRQALLHHVKAMLIGDAPAEE